MKPTHIAAALIRHYALSTDPDQRTSMADSRIALCVAGGVAMEDIDPSSGYDYSRDSYDRSRQSWVVNIRDHGLSDLYEGAALEGAIANWTAHRPDFIADDDWLKAATEAHLAYWEALGQSCTRETCDLHVVGEDGPMVDAPGPGVQEFLFDEPTPPRVAA